jgi:hypothetical protein
MCLVSMNNPYELRLAFSVPLQEELDFMRIIGLVNWLVLW